MRIHAAPPTIYIAADQRPPSARLQPPSLRARPPPRPGHRQCIKYSATTTKPGPPVRTRSNLKTTRDRSQMFTTPAAGDGDGMRGRTCQHQMPCDLRTKNPRREPESWMRSRCDRTPFARRSQCHITSVITFHTHTHKKPCTHAHHHVHLNRPLRTRKSHTRTETKKSRVRLPCRRRCIGDASAPAHGQGTRPKLLGAKHAGFREQVVFVGMRAAAPPPKCYPSACWRRRDGTRSPTLSAPIRPHALPRAAPASSRRAATSP